MTSRKSSNTYLGWLSSAEFCEDLGKRTGDETVVGVKGVVFDDGAFIEFREEGFGCRTGREEIESESLFEVVDFLWHTHSVEN